MSPEHLSGFDAARRTMEWVEYDDPVFEASKKTILDMSKGMAVPKKFRSKPPRL